MIDRLYYQELAIKTESSDFFIFGLKYLRNIYFREIFTKITIELPKIFRFRVFRQNVKCCDQIASAFNTIKDNWATFVLRTRYYKNIAERCVCPKCIILSNLLNIWTWKCGNFAGENNIVLVHRHLKVRNKSYMTWKTEIFMRYTVYPTKDFVQTYKYFFCFSLSCGNLRHVINHKMTSSQLLLSSFCKVLHGYRRGMGNKLVPVFILVK